uniref:Uncharacterized protein n=1 Tax=Physcomitrium patens TaxID=3218 RepID=A0A7I4DD70_PHYPA
MQLSGPRRLADETSRSSVFGPSYRQQPVPELPHERSTLRIQLHRDISLTNLLTELVYESNRRPEQFFSVRCSMDKQGESREGSMAYEM